jgi:hypothetical protein
MDSLKRASADDESPLPWGDPTAIRPNLAAFPFAGQRSREPLGWGFFRADARTRTGDPFITSEVLYQLSYVGEARARSLAACLTWPGAPWPRSVTAPS